MKFSWKKSRMILRTLKNKKNANGKMVKNALLHEKQGVKLVYNNLMDLIRKGSRGNAIGINMISKYENVLHVEEIKDLIAESPSQNPHMEMSDAILAASKFTPEIIDRIEIALTLCSELFDDRDLELPVDELGQESPD